jgi:pellino protein
MRPTGTFESGVAPGEWREATVMGNVRALREQRSSRIPGDAVSMIRAFLREGGDIAHSSFDLQIHEETNILTDGCLIDLCGVTLMWRTAIGLEQGPVRIVFLVTA